MKKLAISIVVSLLLFSCSSVPDDPNATIAAAYSGYTTWEKVNSVTISGDSTGVLGKAHEGSAGFREVYIHAVGMNVSDGTAPLPYPQGTVIVKESFKKAGDGKGAMTGLTIMVKRSAGYDAENGDWEYIMLTPKMKVQAQGRLSACISCHLAADKDFVFTDNR